MVGCLNPSRSQRFFSSPKFASIKLPTQWMLGVFPGLKRLGLNLDHSPPSITAVKKDWDFTSAPSDCLRGMDTNNFTFFIKRRLGQTEYVPCITQKWTACRRLVGKHEGRRKLGRHVVNERLLLNWILKDVSRNMWTELIGIRIVVSGCLL
jgi:hypothetical protein